IPTIRDFDNRTLALVDRAGIQTPLDIHPGPYNHPRISPNGKQLAVNKQEVATGRFGPVGVGDIWTFDLTGSAGLSRMTFTGRNSSPIWTRDSERIVFASERDGSIGLFSQRVDTPGSVELLMKFEQGNWLKPESVSRDGTLLFTANPGTEAARVWTLL